MSKRTSRRILVTLIVGAALVAPAVEQTAMAQTSAPSKNIIDVDPTTGVISKGLVLVAGAGNYVTISVTSRAAAPFIASATTGSGYVAGELVVPSGGFVTVPIYGANGSLASNIRVWDAKTVNAVLSPDLVGSAANLSVSATSKNVTKPLSAFVLDQLYANPAKNVTTAIRVFDHRTDPNIIKAPDLLGTSANLSQPVTSNGIERPLALWIYDVIGAPPAGVALATSFPKPAVTVPAVSVPAVSVPAAPPAQTANAVTTVAPPVVGGVSASPATPGAPVAPIVVPTPPAALNPTPVPGQVAVGQQSSVAATRASQTPPVSLSIGNKTCVKSVTKRVKVGRKRVRQKVCVQYRTVG